MNMSGGDYVQELYLGAGGLCLGENMFRGFRGGDYIWEIKYLVILTRHHLDGLDLEASVESSF